MKGYHLMMLVSWLSCGLFFGLWQKDFNAGMFMITLIMVIGLTLEELFSD